jgi:hypothetical protein
MKRISGIALLSILLLGSASAMAAPGLTQQECHEYPFVQLKGAPTHKQLMQELGELEAVGYDASANDNSYPSELDQAQAKLQAEYRADCMPGNGQANGTSTPSPAANGASAG